MRIALSGPLQVLVGADAPGEALLHAPSTAPATSTMQRRFTQYQITRTITLAAAMTTGPSRSPSQPNATSNNGTELDDLYAAGSRVDLSASRS